MGRKFGICDGQYQGIVGTSKRNQSNPTARSALAMPINCEAKQASCDAPALPCLAPPIQGQGTVWREKSLLIRETTSRACARRPCTPRAAATPASVALASREKVEWRAPGLKGN
jgi:hypothetical protein